MKRLNYILRNPLAAYLISSYLLFPLFLLRYLDFQQRTIFGDMGFTIPELLGMILLSPYYVLYFGICCVRTPQQIIGVLRDNREPGRKANRSQPVGQETNRVSSTGGSRR